MNIIRKSFNPLFAVLLFATLFFIASSGVRVLEFKAEIPQDSSNEIHLKWVVTDEVGIQHYQLKRKMVQDQDFKSIEIIQTLAGGSSQTKTYEYIDRNVFRTTANSEPVIYKLHIHYTNGGSDLIGQAQINYSSTAIRRTWGSIKAMFQ